MGERMRAFDWSTSALGPQEQWPHSLRICASCWAQVGGSPTAADGDTPSSITTRRPIRSRQEPQLGRRRKGTTPSVDLRATRKPRRETCSPSTGRDELD